MADEIVDDAPETTARKPDPGVAGGRDEAETIGRTVTINKPRDELYAFWRDFPRLVAVMDNVQSIEKIDDRRSRWTVTAPGDRTVSWDAIVTEDVPGALIAWESDEGAEVRNSGRVEFRDAGARGTEVTAVIAYDPPGGTIGKIVAKLFQREPRIQSRRDLRRFKQLMETGEIATSYRTKTQGV